MQGTGGPAVSGARTDEGAVGKQMFLFEEEGTFIRVGALQALDIMHGRFFATPIGALSTPKRGFA